MSMRLDGVAAKYPAAVQWNKGELARFCMLGHQMFERQIDARLYKCGITDRVERKKILEALMEEVDIMTQQLIIIALNHKHLSVGNLKQEQPTEQQMGRSLFIEEDE